MPENFIAAAPRMVMSNAVNAVNKFFLELFPV